jgi:hypothetical protein
MRLQPGKDGEKPGHIFIVLGLNFVVPAQKITMKARDSFSLFWI